MSSRGAKTENGHVTTTEYKLKDGKIKTKEGEFNLSLAVNNDNIDKQIYDNNLLDKNNFVHKLPLSYNFIVI